MVHLPENRGDKARFDYLQSFALALQNFPGLAQLMIWKDDWYDYRNCATKDELVAAGENLALLVPGLRCIGVGRLFWRVWRNGDGTVGLEELDDREKKNVELFCHTIFESEI